LISSAIFAQLTAEDAYTLQWAAFSPKIALLPGGSTTPSNTWFLGSTQHSIRNGISISSESMFNQPSVLNQLPKRQRIEITGEGLSRSDALARLAVAHTTVSKL